MSKYYLLAIPVAIGVVVALIMTITNVEQVESDNNLLTAQRLISDGSPIVGDPQAHITILEWGDYQCTFCYRFHESSLEIITQEYIQPGKARLVFKDFPLNGPDSILAAEALTALKIKEGFGNTTMSFILIGLVSVQAG